MNSQVQQISWEFASSKKEMEEQGKATLET